MMNSVISTLYCIWVITGIVFGRDARNDICARFPWFSACGRTADEVHRQGQHLAADSPQPPSSSSSDEKTFCQQHRAQYESACVAGAQRDDQSDRFCLYYTKNCDTGSTSVGDSNPTDGDQSAHLCQQLTTMSRSYCNGQETGNIMRYCDTYRRTCLSSTSPSISAEQADAQTGEGALNEKIQYCARYESAYNGYCGGKTPSGRVAEFCYAYMDYCGSLAQTNETSDTGPSQGEATPFPNYNNSERVRRLCDQYGWMANRSCPGFEVEQLREYCNVYRVYCRGRDPVPTIDGSFGWTKDNWGVAGIPYYPFNPQGAIGGGERNNVGFGDWGANFQQRKGVTDFWDRNNQAEANWQKGHYGYNKGWNVPLLGIGGYKKDDVNVGGLLNPSDIPAISSGGTLPVGGGAPSFGGGSPAFGGDTSGFLSGLGNLLGG